MRTSTKAKKSGCGCAGGEIMSRFEIGWCCFVLGLVLGVIFVLTALPS